MDKKAIELSKETEEYKNNKMLDNDKIHKAKQMNKMVRISTYCPEELRREYKALLAKQGKTIQDDIIEYIHRIINEAKK